MNKSISRDIKKCPTCKTEPASDSGQQVLHGGSSSLADIFLQDMLFSCFLSVLSLCVLQMFSTQSDSTFQQTAFRLLAQLVSSQLERRSSPSHFSQTSTFSFQDF